LPIKTQIKKLLFSDISTNDCDQKIDHLLGIDPEKVERLLDERKEDITKGQDAYLGESLSPHALFTSYRDCYQILSHLKTKPGEVLLDLGAGMGRMSITAALFFPHLKVKSIEMIKQRIELAIKVYKNLKLSTEGFIIGRFENIDLQGTHYIFLYLSSNSILKTMMEKLKNLALAAPFQIIAVESHGDLLPTLRKDYPWLITEPFKLKTFSKRWNQNITFFKPLPLSQMKNYHKEEKDLFQHFFEILKKEYTLLLKDIPQPWRHPFLLHLAKSKDFELVIKDKDVGCPTKYCWLASTFELSKTLEGEKYQAMFPEREFSMGQIESIIRPGPNWHDWRKLRFKNTKLGSFGEVRKIVISPKKMIEFSLRGRIPLEDLNINKDLY